MVAKVFNINVRAVVTKYKNRYKPGLKTTFGFLNNYLDHMFSR